jgi:preprotein translocase subunit SecE
VNRQTKRLLQRQGQLGPDGEPAVTRRSTTPAGTGRRPAEVRREPRTRRIATYLNEVRIELSKVLWPKRSEIVNYSTVVLTTLVFLALLIFGLNYVFAKGVLFLFKS